MEQDIELHAFGTYAPPTAEINRLNRLVIPFYRNQNYRLSKKGLKPYRDFVIAILLENKTSM